MHISSRSCGPGFRSATAFERNSEVLPDVEPRQSPGAGEPLIGCRTRSVSTYSRRRRIEATRRFPAKIGVSWGGDLANMLRAAFWVEGLQSLWNLGGASWSPWKARRSFNFWLSLRLAFLVSAASSPCLGAEARESGHR